MGPRMQKALFYYIVDFRLWHYAMKIYLIGPENAKDPLKLGLGYVGTIIVGKLYSCKFVLVQLRAAVNA